MACWHAKKQHDLHVPHTNTKLCRIYIYIHIIYHNKPYEHIGYSMYLRNRYSMRGCVKVVHISYII